MRIGIVINTSWNIYNFRASLIRRLVKEGFDVIAIAPLDEFSNRLTELGCSYHTVEMDNTGSNPIKDFTLFLDLKRIYKSERLDIVLQFTIKPNIYGTLAANSLGIVSINNVSGLGTVFLNKGVTAMVAKYLYRRSFRKANMIFFQNEDDRKDFMHHVGFTKLNYDLLPGSGVDLTHFKPLYKTETSPFRFLMIARLILDKGVMEYLEAAKIMKSKHPDIEFCLAGPFDEGHRRGISSNLIEENQAIEYIGVSDDVRSWIRESDCVVLPSYREGTPKTLLESAAMAKPIITTDVPGCREVVRDGENGFLCKVKSSIDLTRKMQQMHSMKPEERRKMGVSGRQLVEDHFDQEIVINKYLKYIYQYSG